MFWKSLFALSLLGNAVKAAVIPELLPREAQQGTHPIDLEKRSPLTDCLLVPSKGIVIIAPGYTTYGVAAQSYNRRFNFQPAVLTYPSTIAQVQEIIRCANTHNVKVQARGGGHSYAAHGVGGVSGSLVVDLEKFNGVSLGSGTAIVGAGNRLGRMATKLWELGQKALPHGTCAGVGVGGHALHGGYGPISRNWGLAVDSITALKGVLADGTQFTASTTQNTDLFWALRGAAASFAIVTEFTFKTYTPPARIIHFSYGFSFANANQAADAYFAFQEFSRTAPKELWIRVYAENGYFNIGGSYFINNRAQFDALIAPLETRLTQIYGRAPSKSVVDLNWPETLVRYNGSPLTEYGKFDTFYAKSLEVPQDSLLTLATIRSLFNYIFTTGRNSPNPWFFIANLYGGPNSQINALPLTTNSYGHRDTFISFQFYGWAPGNVPPFPPAVITLINGMYNSIANVQSPVGKARWPGYINYVDSELTRPVAHEVYFGSQLTRLKTLKRRFDPGQRFWNPQSIDL